MEQSQADTGYEQRGKQSPRISWRVIRKVEGLVFFIMLFAIPFFALRIVDLAGTTLMVQNTAVDLVNDLIRAKELARNFKLTVTLASNQKSPGHPPGYCLKNGERVMEQVDIPSGVNLYGSVTFDQNGLPIEPASFIVSKGARSVTVDVDAKGYSSLR